MPEGVASPYSVYLDHADGQGKWFAVSPIDAFLRVEGLESVGNGKECSSLKQKRWRPFPGQIGPLCSKPFPDFRVGADRCQTILDFTQQPLVSKDLLICHHCPRKKTPAA
jgi:hypothetical protein